MVNPARHDYAELPYLYGAAIIIILFLSAISAPIDTSRLGLIVPKAEEAEHSMYDKAAFEDVAVRAKAYVVYDLVDKVVIAGKNEEEYLPLASITKVMTAITALSHHDVRTNISIEPSSIDGGYDLGLAKGQRWSLNELLKYTLVFSSNDGAYAIADAFGGREAFVSQMNTDSALLGLGLSFTDPAGLDVGSLIGGKGTAIDVAKLFGIARKNYPEILAATTKARVTVLAGKDKLTGVPNTNQEIGSLFGAEASKTGFTDSAGGNLGVVVDVSLGRPVAIVVLGSTKEGRFSDTEALYQALLKSIK